MCKVFKNRLERFDIKKVEVCRKLLYLQRKNLEFIPMAKKNQKKTVKVVKTANTEKKATKTVATRRKVRPTESRSKTRSSNRVASTTARKEDMIFGKQNYILMGAGLLLVIIGFMLMSGGAQPDDAWNPDEIYSFRRTVLAPIVILAGLAIEVFAIFKK